MSYWYPKVSRAAELSDSLKRLEKALLQGPALGPENINYLSERLVEGEQRSEFLRAQMPRWLWIASQYRRHVESQRSIAARAGAALQFLDRVLTQPELTEADHQDLNWVLDATIAHLGVEVGPADLRGFLSEDELHSIERRLSDASDDEPFDLDGIRSSVSRRLNVLQSFPPLGDQADIEAKLRSLFEAAARPGVEHAPARMALKYLAEEDDVVPDHHGLLGLVDDLYVIEWAYAAVESQTRCLPILSGLLRRWPFLASTGLGANGSLLDRFGQYVACGALVRTFGGQSGIIVLREVGPYAIISAVAVALECARAQSDAFDDELIQWSEGDPITIGDGETRFCARYGGIRNEFTPPRMRIHVAENGSITVGPEVLPYISKSRRDWQRLSNGRQILAWLKDRNADSLIGLTGTGRRRPELHEAVLLVSQRTKIDRYLNLIRPFGTRSTSLLGATWVDSTGKSTEVSGSSTDRPLLYACNDPSVACELIAEPPAHISKWRIIVDGAYPARTLYAALATSNRVQGIDLCAFCDLADREATDDLISQGLADVWYMEDQDVLVPPLAYPTHIDTDDALERFLKRRSAHWGASYQTRTLEEPFLEAVASCLHSTNRSESDDLALHGLNLSIASFLRRATSAPLFGDEERNQLRDLARTIQAQASLLAMYDQEAAEVCELFRKLSSGELQLSDRRAALVEVAGSNSDGSLAVACGSSTAVERCELEARSDERLHRIKWATLETVRSEAPFEHLIVAGWLGRQNMRELSNNGYAAITEMILLPFERTWFERTLAAGRKWERRIEGMTTSVLGGLVAAGYAGAPSTPWHDQAQRRATRPERVEHDPINDEPEINVVEARAVETLNRVLPRARERGQTARAQLVLFQEPGALAFLPPTGHVIALSTNDRRLRPGQAERDLLVSVSRLAPDMIVALPEETDRDLIDARADNVLGDNGATRHLADTWKRSLKEFFELLGTDYQSFAAEMADAGEPRDAQTIKSWATDTRSVAPRRYKTVLPLLSELTCDVLPKGSLPKVIGAIEKVYRARTEAAESLVAEIFSGELDLTASSLVVEVDGKELRYALQKVDRCAGLTSVPHELIGRLLRFQDLQSFGQLAA